MLTSEGERRDSSWICHAIGSFERAKRVRMAMDIGRPRWKFLPSKAELGLCRLNTSFWEHR